MSMFFDIAEFKFWNIRWQRAIDDWAPGAAEIMMNHLHDEAPYDDSPYRDPDKPHLRDMLSFEISNTGRGSEGQISFYGPDLAMLLESGAPPHEISGDPVLHFFTSDGDEGFAAYVEHPGFQPDKFVERAYRNAKGDIFDHFKATIEDNIVVV